MKVSRRAILGTLLSAPALNALSAVQVQSGGGERAFDQPEPLKEENRVEHEVGFNAGPKKAVDIAKYATVLMGMVDKRLKGDRQVRLVVGPQESRVGSMWGTGMFDRRVYALLPDITLDLDRVYLNGVADLIAQRIREEQIVYFGRLPLPAGAEVAHRENGRIALRFVMQYGFDRDAWTGRVDILGGRKVEAPRATA